MTHISPPPVTLDAIIRDHLLEWSRRQELSTASAALPLKSVGDIHFRPTDEPLIKARRGWKERQNLKSWPAVAVHAKPNPTLCCVLDGVADLGIGVTDVMARNANETTDCGIYQARLQEKCILIYPPNVPVCDGKRPHWDEEGVPQPDCTILWIDVMAEGALLHTCHSVRRQHLLGESRFLVNLKLLPLVENMIDEMHSATTPESGSPASAEIVNSLLHTLILYIFRSMAEQKSQENLPVNMAVIDMICEHDLDGKRARAASSSHTVSKCCSYINERLDQRLNVEKIANYVFVSPAQLNRFFRAELNQSVMQYVNEQRLDRAKKMLASTNLPISFISENLGFLETPHFNRFFREKMGMTPTDYRRSRI